MVGLFYRHQVGGAAWGGPKASALLRKAEPAQLAIHPPTITTTHPPTITATHHPHCHPGPRLLQAHAHHHRQVSNDETKGTREKAVRKQRASHPQFIIANMNSS